MTVMGRRGRVEGGGEEPRFKRGWDVLRGGGARADGEGSKEDVTGGAKGRVAACFFFSISLG